MKRLHPISGARRAIVGAVQGLTLGVFLSAILGSVLAEPEALLLLGLAPLGFLIGGAWAVARYLRFTYALADGRLVVASGVFDRQERDIPVGRLQNVDLERGVFHRLFGLAVVRFETAGGSATEAILDAVTHDEGKRLQEAVASQRRQANGRASGEERGASGAVASTGESEGEGRTGAAVGDEAAERAEIDPDRTPLYQLSLRDLLLLGLVSVRPGAPILTIISVPILERIAWQALAAGSTAVGGPAVTSFGELAALGAPDLLLVTAVGVGQFVVASWVVSAAITMTAYYDFELVRVGEELRYERGLIGRYSGSVPIEKIQSVSVHENALMRPLGYASLSIETAGYAPGSNSGGVSNTAVPLDDRRTVVRFAEALGGVEYPSVERPPLRAMRRYAARFALLVLAVTGILLAVDRLVVAIAWWPAPLAGLALAPLAGFLQWRHRGHAVVDDAFVARSGFWSRATRVVPYYRIQTIIASRTVFQRRLDLASVTADTASTASLLGGDATAHDVDDETAHDLHRELRERLAEELERRRRSDDHPSVHDIPDALVPATPTDEGETVEPLATETDD